jgi:hypothetical protein
MTKDDFAKKKVSNKYIILMKQFLLSYYETLIYVHVCD